MKKLILLCLAVFFLTCASCFAGAWGSSGGESFGDTHNPWFLQNTPVVHYCVKIDPLGFSASPESANRLVSRAIQYWAGEFHRVKEVMQWQFDADVATQQFIKVECQGYKDPGVDLTFQLGYGTLDEAQRTFLENPRKYVGIAVRTDYDEVNLRAKGFVYISSDVGPNRFDAESVGVTSPFVDRAWSYEGLLYRALAHELGHVFGVPHVGGAVQNVSVVHNANRPTASLMSEEFPEQIVRRDSYLAYSGSDEIDPFFTPRTRFQDCSLSDYARRFFNLWPSDKCVGVEFRIGTSSVDVALAAGPSSDQPKRPLGFAHWTDWDKDGGKLNIQIVVKVRLNAKQKVFTLPPGSTAGSVVGGAMFSLDFPLTYQEPTGAQRSIFFQLSPQSATALGEVGGKTVLLLDSR